MTQANVAKIAYTALLRQVPVTFTFSSATYTGVRGAIRQSSEMMDPGFITDADLVIIILLADYVTAPTTGDTITVSSVNYRVDKTTSESTGTIRTLYLNKVK